MTVASFIAAQRTDHGVPPRSGLSGPGGGRPRRSTSGGTVPRPRAQVRRDGLDEAVKASFDDSGGTPGTYGSPRVFEDLIEDGWVVSVNTVADFDEAVKVSRVEPRNVNGGR